MLPALARSIIAPTIWVMLKVPFRLVETTASNWSGFMRTSSPSRVMPALLTSTAGTPSSSLICLTAASHAA